MGGVEGFKCLRNTGGTSSDWNLSRVSDHVGVTEFDEQEHKHAVLFSSYSIKGAHDIAVVLTLNGRLGSICHVSLFKVTLSFLFLLKEVLCTSHT